jgi:hypothetical protein
MEQTNISECSGPPPRWLLLPVHTLATLHSEPSGPGSGVEIAETPIDAVNFLGAVHIMLCLTC